MDKFKTTPIKELINWYTECLDDKSNFKDVIFLNGVIASLSSRLIQEKEMIIEAFLNGKKFANGVTFAPLASRDIAIKWFSDNYGY